jgi:hypothetical protein
VACNDIDVVTTASTMPHVSLRKRGSNSSSSSSAASGFSSNNQGWSILQTTRFLGEADSFSMLIVLVVLIMAFMVAFVIRSTNFRYMPEAAAALLFGVVFGGGIRLVSDIEQLQRVVLLDRETFFLILLPPIIFNGGINTKQRDFVDTIDGAILLAFIGTVVSAFVVGGILYAAVATGRHCRPDVVHRVHGLWQSHFRHRHCYCALALRRARRPLDALLQRVWRVGAQRRRRHRSVQRRDRV